jgi:hypothetical protein
MEQNIFNDIINTGSYFLDIPDCITEANDYKQTIEDACKLTEGLLVLDNYEAVDNDEEFLLQLTLNGSSEVFKIPFTSDYIEGEVLVSQLNNFLDKSNDTNTKKFIVLAGLEIDFGIAFITVEEKATLIEKGFIYEIFSNLPCLG